MFNTIFQDLLIKTNQQVYYDLKLAFPILQAMNIKTRQNNVALGNFFVTYKQFFEAQSALNNDTRYGTAGDKTASNPFSDVTLADFAKQSKQLEIVYDEKKTADFDWSTKLSVFSSVLNNQFLTPALFLAVVNEVRPIMEKQIKMLAIQYFAKWLSTDITSKKFNVITTPVASKTVNTYTDAELLDIITNIKIQVSDLNTSSNDEILKDVVVGDDQGSGKGVSKTGMYYSGADKQRIIAIDYILWNQIQTKVKAGIFQLEQLNIEPNTRFVAVNFENLAKKYPAFATEYAKIFKFNKPLYFMMDVGVYNTFGFYEAIKNYDTPKLYSNMYVYAKWGQFRDKRLFLGVAGVTKDTE